MSAVRISASFIFVVQDKKATIYIFVNFLLQKLNLVKRLS